MLLNNGVSLLRERREQVFRPCGGDLLLPAAAKVSKSAGRRRGQFECPLLLHLFPSDQRGACGPPLDSPLERVLVRSDVAQRIGSSVWTSPRDTVECRARGRQCPNGQAASAGKSKRGASAPLWSLRRVGGSKGEGDPFERVPFPLGVLLPSFPTREKKVAPAGAKLPCARYFYGA